jgi:hypothetical protein
MPTGTPQFIQDPNSNVAKVTTIGQLKTNQVFDTLKPSYHENITGASGGTQLADVQVGQLYIQSLSGNSVMYVGGVGTDAPFSGRGIILYSNRAPLMLPISNANKVSVYATTSGQMITYWGFINGSNTIMDPSRQGITPPNTTPPVYLSSDPIDGASLIERNGTTFLAYFSAPLDASTVNTSSFTMFQSGAGTRTSGSASLITSGGQVAQFQNLSILTASAWYNCYLTPLIKNINGFALSATGSFSFLTKGVADSTPPTIASSVPASGSTGISIDTDITVTMSEVCSGGAAAMTPVIAVVNSGNTNFPGTLTFDNGVTNKVFTFSPNSSLNSNDYLSVKVSGIYDIASNVMTPATIRFDTEIQAAPVVTSSDPLSGTGGVNTNNNIVVYMDKKCSGAGGAMATVLRLEDVSGNNYPGTITFDTVTQKVFTLNPTATMPYSSIMTIKVSGIRDLFGTVMTPVNIPFTSADPALTQVYSVVPTISTQTLTSTATRAGEFLRTPSSSLAGKKIRQVKVYLKKSGSPTSLVKVTLRQQPFGSDTDKSTIGTIPAQSLTTSFALYTFTNLSSTYVLQYPDMLCVQVSGSQMGSDSIFIQTAGDVLDGINSFFIRQGGSDYDLYSSQDIAGSAYT